MAWISAKSCAMLCSLPGGNGLTRQPDHKGLVAELVDVRRHRPEPGHESEIENGRHGGGQEALEYAGAQTAKGDRLGRQVAHHKHGEALMCGKKKWYETVETAWPRFVSGWNRDVAIDNARLCLQNSVRPSYPAPLRAPQPPSRSSFPESLPVSGKREEIMAAIEKHQVIIVCGETGSGKTTQLPKIALALGRGKCNAQPGQRGRLIGHTQPRRIAASSVAKRIAEELNTPLGEVVGYKVRFQDTAAKAAPRSS